jgi:hypothetical protein
MADEAGSWDLVTVEDVDYILVVETVKNVLALETVEASC